MNFAKLLIFVGAVLLSMTEWRGFLENRNKRQWRSVECELLLSLCMVDVMTMVPVSSFPPFLNSLLAVYYGAVAF